MKFHRAIADAARNPGATRVIRANEARRADFAAQVQGEHETIVSAIEAGDTAKARQAAARHMNNAIRRIERADPAFWRQEGDRLALPLVRVMRPK